MVEQAVRLWWAGMPYFLFNCYLGRTLDISFSFVHVFGGERWWRCGRGNKAEFEVGYVFRCSPGSSEIIDGSGHNFRDFFIY